MADNGRYLIGESLREKLKSTISKVDALAPGAPVSRIPTFLEEMSPYNPKVFRMCTFTGTWAIGTDKIVTFRGVTATPNTVSVTNLVCGLSTTATCDISVAKDGTAWYLIQPNLTQQPGYSTSGTQFLTIVNGSLQWGAPERIETHTTSVLTSVSLGTAGLNFGIMNIKILGTVSSSSTTIGTTACV
jgi:hypothetical protein